MPKDEHMSNQQVQALLKEAALEAIRRVGFENIRREEFFGTNERKIPLLKAA